MKTPILVIAAFLYLAGIIYLIQPSPDLPSLADSTRSDEPGDTIQHPDQAAYYTDRDNREKILGELQKKFGLPRFSPVNYRLNYRPEEVGTLVRDQLRSYYLEEVVHPLRESLYINVLDPAKTPLIDDDKREQAKMYLHGRFYPVKVTLRPVYSKVSGRLIVWTSIFPALALVYLSLKKSLKSQI